MTGSETVPSNQKMILNANQGVTNIIESKVIHGDMARITDKIFDVLKGHYGPFSSFAALDPNEPLQDTEFTKDGASIIGAIEFASPLEDWVRRAVHYVGKRIESAAGDGTTSSMMFTCGMLKNCTASIREILPISYNDIRNCYNEFIDRVKKGMKAYTITAKKGDSYDEDLVEKISYMQAYTSSHGNVELSKAVASMFARTPSDMWGKMTFQRRNYESDDDFEIVESEGQYKLKAEIMSKTLYNKDNGRYLELDNCTLAIINGRITEDTMYWSEIKDKILTSTNEKPFAIFCYNDFDNNVYARLMEFTTQAREDGTRNVFAVFTATPVHPRINDHVVLQTICGGNPLEYSGGEFADRPLFIEGTRVKYEFDQLTLDKLYVDPREESHSVRERPMYTDQSKAYFRELAETMKKYIDRYEKTEISQQQQLELRNFQRMYNNLVYDKQITLVIGGKTFDNLAMFSVVDDVIRATIRSLENGCVVSNNKTLLKVVGDVQDESNGYDAVDFKRARKEKIIRWFAKNVIDTILSFSDVVMDMLYPSGMIPELQERKDKSVFEKLFLDKGLTTFTEDDREMFRNWWFNNSVNLLEYNLEKGWLDQNSHCRSKMDQIILGYYQESSMVVQPANADIVMLERFGEIALKFLLTNRVIVANSAYMNDKKGKKNDKQS